MAVTVVVSSSQFEDGARQFEQSRKNCEQAVKKMMNTCTGLKNKWKSPAATQYYNKLQQLSGELEDIKRIINEHVNDLREIKKIFEQAEDTAANKIGSLNTDVLHY